MISCFVWTIIFAISAGFAGDCDAKGVAFAFGFCSIVCMCGALLRYLEGPSDYESLRHRIDDTIS